MGDQRAEDERRLARYVERHQLVSAMNDTKWSETVASLRRVLGEGFEFRVRCVRDPLDLSPRRDRSFPWHLPPYRHIEWLDVDPVVGRLGGAGSRGVGKDLTEAVLAALKAIGAPTSLENEYVRIWGYYRPTAPSSEAR